jgi:hypothetical protein
MDGARQADRVRFETGGTNPVRGARSKEVDRDRYQTPRSSGDRADQREYATAADEEFVPGWYWGESGDPFPGVGPFDTRDECERDAVEDCGSLELTGIKT